MSTFQIFPNFGRGGGGHRKSNFSQIQNSPHYPRGGGSRKLWTFSTICDISFLDGSPKVIFVKLVMKGLINCVKLG